MVKTMKRGLSLMFVLSLLVSMLVIPAKATNTTKSVTIPSYGNSIKYATIYTDKSFLGLKKTTVTVTNTRDRLRFTVFFIADFLLSGQNRVRTSNACFLRLPKQNKRRRA